MTSHQLERIEIEGYKSIRKASIELRSLNVLIGANGAGKSNFISLFGLLNAIIEKRLQVYSGQRGADSFFHFGLKRTPELRISLDFLADTQGRANGYEVVLKPSDQDTLIFEDESYYFWLKEEFPNPRWYHIGSGQNETRLHTQPYARTVYVIDAIDDWKVYHFHDTSSSAIVKQSGQLDDNRFLRSDASNLAAFLYFLRERRNDYYTRIVKTIQRVAPFFDDFMLEPSELNPDRIRLEWREVGLERYSNAHTLSDGTLRFICLTTLLLQPELPSVVLIDEPELGLHPYAITLLASLLRTAAASTQVIVSTQSVPLINQLSPEDILVVEREDEQSVFKRLDADILSGWLEEYGLGDLWEKNVIGGRPTR